MCGIDEPVRGNGHVLDNDRIFYERSITDDRPEQYGFKTNETVLAERAGSVYETAVRERRVLFDLNGAPGKRVNNDAILYIAVITDDDRAACFISTDHGVRPHENIIADTNITDDHGAGVDVWGTLNIWFFQDVHGLITLIKRAQKGNQE